MKWRVGFKGPKSSLGQEFHSYFTLGVLIYVLVFTLFVRCQYGFSLKERPIVNIPLS